MKREEWNQTITDLLYKAEEMNLLAMKLLDAAEEGNFVSLTKDGYAKETQIPRWEKRNAICTWGDVRHLVASLTEFAENARDAK